MLPRFPFQRLRDLDNDPCRIAMKMRKRGGKPVKIRERHQIMVAVYDADDIREKENRNSSIDIVRLEKKDQYLFNAR